MVYVDNMKEKYGRMIMCHMFADTKQELLEMAEKIGVNKKWIQNEDAYKEHFDIALCKRKIAIENGAIEISRKDVAILLKERQNTTT